MFVGYRIKNVNNEDVLYLYTDMYYEFAKIDRIKDNRSFIDKIIDYININKINFNGKKIVIIINGLILGTFFLSVSLGSSSVNKNDNIKYVDKVFLNTYNKDNEIEDVTIIDKKDSDEKLVINDDNYTIVNDKKENTSNNNGLSKSNTSNKEKKSIIEENKEVKPDINYDVGNSNDKETLESKPNGNDNKTMVTIYRSNGIVVVMDIEEYLIGVVGSEMPASFNIEALKVQAIIARTYALRSIEKGKILTDTVSTQVYKDTDQLKAIWGDSYSYYYGKVVNAVNSTKDIKIKYNNALIEAVYFSCSNGYTEDSYNVWGNFVPYLKSIENKWDISTSAYYRETLFSYADLTLLLGINIDDAVSFNINSRNESNRVSNVSINNINYSGIELRNMLSLRSSDFDIEKVDNGLKFITRGYGHGVGLSQYGANVMASNGYDYKQIIHYYYQGVSIVK